MISIPRRRLLRVFNRNDGQTAPLTQQALAADSVFPLRLNPTELCWLLEDRPAYPMHFFLRLRFKGKLRRAALQQALQAALDRHPLLTAVVRQNGKTSWQWIPSPQQLPTIRWFDGDVHNDNFPHLSRIDIYREHGVRVTAIQDRDRADLILQFQHTACDGLSASDFAGDLLTAYANLVTSDAEFRFKRVDPAGLRIRSKLDLSPWEVVNWLARHCLELRRFRHFYKRKPLTIGSRTAQGEPSDQKNRVGSFGHMFSSDESVSIQRTAKRAGTTVNSLLLRDTFLTLRDWCRENATIRDSDVLRLTMPVSMRTAVHRTMPAANIVSLICLDRTLAETRDASSLLHGIDREIEKAKARALVFSLGLRILQFSPTHLAKGLRRKQFSGSALLTNIGPALANCHLPRREGRLTVGDLSLEQVQFLPVLRPNQAVTVGVTTYARMIGLGMRYNSQIVTTSEARQIFERLIGRFQGSVPSRVNTKSNRSSVPHEYAQTEEVDVEFT